MSGIVGILNFDGAPVDRDLLWRMTIWMSPHGPDAQEIWVDDNIGFGHAMLRTTFEAAGERQPLTLDGRTWITADCRVDAREDLIRKLGGHAIAPRSDAPDPELILQAYNVWGSDCVNHLLGDFSFAIWDGARRRLFCARDHFGVKPFYYGQFGETVVFSNMLKCLRLHPKSTTELDELAIADFLLFGYCLDFERTSFRRIRRLPPAHTLTVEGAQTQLRRYWQLAIGEELRYRTHREYIDHFHELFAAAVKDRLRTNRAAVFMSGGLDSTSVAAVAKQVLDHSGAPYELSAHTIVIDRLVPDEERKYSTIAADHIGIPIYHYPNDDFVFPPENFEIRWCPPEPCSVWDWDRVVDNHRGPVASARVLLQGSGADPLFDPSIDALETYINTGRYRELLAESVWLALARRQLPRLGVRTWIRRRIGRTPLRSPLEFPEWIACELVRKLDLNSRWQSEVAPNNPDFTGLRCELGHAYWSIYFEKAAPSTMNLSADMRYPFADLRVVLFSSRLPLIPWCIEKSFLRVAMKGLLPRQTLNRPKAPMAGNPWVMMLRHPGTRWWENIFELTPGLGAFLDREKASSRLPAVLRQARSDGNRAMIDALNAVMRPVALSVWMHLVVPGDVWQNRQVSCGCVP